jgi:hypothetical protein
VKNGQEMSKDKAAADPISDEELKLYEQWIRFLFDRPDTAGLPEWYWDTNLEEFSATPEQQVSLIGRTFERSGTDLLKYSEKQVNNGLNYIVNNAISNTVMLIIQKEVPEDLRIDAVLKMKYLYRDCFAKRCEPVLSALDEPDAGPINSICYMLWDTSPLCQWKDVVLEVMEYALYLPNDACIESGLHGLGHRFSQDKERVPQIIDRFLSKTKALRPELREYAARARTGYIQ